MRKSVVLLLFIMIISCSERKLPTVTEDTSLPVIEKYIVPEFINPDKIYTISVKVTSSQTIDFVTLSIYKEGSETVLSEHKLYDDGGAVHVSDGDMIAHDGLFTQIVKWETDDDAQQNILFEFTAVQDYKEIGDQFQVVVISQKNLLPEILSVDIPDTLKSGFDGELEFTASVYDSNGLQDVKTVMFKGKMNNDVYFQGYLSATAEAGIFNRKVDKSFAIGKKGLYDLDFEAVDQSNRKSLPYPEEIYIENTAPELYDIQAPTEYTRPEGDVVEFFLVTIKAKDEQTIKDIKYVKMSWQKADGTFSENSPFDLYDNGLPLQDQLAGWDQGYRGDLVANDGIYSIAAAFDSEQPLGDYELVFWAEDLAGNRSESLVYKITLK
ncbi:hypothetical protein JXQ31_09105 [candidate division KSB1 bacterium]|nr:hypothetical protein [candidate division KSB1 bacterium]